MPDAWVAGLQWIKLSHNDPNEMSKQHTIDLKFNIHWAVAWENDLYL